MLRRAVRTNWYQDFFRGVALDVWREVIAEQPTAAEVDFLVAELGAPAGGRLLDVPCGNGRHALELARRGYRVTGVDISEEFLAEARAGAAAAGLDVEWKLGDMGRLKGDPASYDGAYCLGNSFGYLDGPGMKSFLDRLARLLRPGARVVVATGMAAESVLPRHQEHEEFTIGDVEMTIDSRYNTAASCVEEEYTFARGGETEVRESVHWVYTTAEIQRMLARSKLDTIALYGSTDRQPFTLGASELYVVAQKRG